MVLATLTMVGAGTTMKGIETNVNERDEMKERIEEVVEQEWEQDGFEEQSTWAYNRVIDGQRVNYYVTFDGGKVFNIAFEYFDEDTYHINEYGCEEGSKEFEKQVDEAQEAWFDYMGL